MIIWRFFLRPRPAWNLKPAQVQSLYTSVKGNPAGVLFSASLGSVSVMATCFALQAFFLQSFRLVSAITTCFVLQCGPHRNQTLSETGAWGCRTMPLTWTCRPLTAPSSLSDWGLLLWLVWLRATAVAGLTEGYCCGRSDWGLLLWLASQAGLTEGYYCGWFGWGLLLWLVWGLLLWLVWLRATAMAGLRATAVTGLTEGYCCGRSDWGLLLWPVWLRATAVAGLTEGYCCGWSDWGLLLWPVWGLLLWPVWLRATAVAGLTEGYCCGWSDWGLLLWPVWLRTTAVACQSSCLTKGGEWMWWVLCSSIAGHYWLTTLLLHCRATRSVQKGIRPLGADTKNFTFPSDSIPWKFNE